MKRHTKFHRLLFATLTLTLAFNGNCIAADQPSDRVRHISTVLAKGAIGAATLLPTRYCYQKYTAAKSPWWATCTLLCAASVAGIAYDAFKNCRKALNNERFEKTDDLKDTQNPAYLAPAIATIGTIWYGLWLGTKTVARGIGQGSQYILDTAIQWWKKR